MENELNPLAIIAKYGAMSARECAEYLPGLSAKTVDEKIRIAFREGKLKRRLDGDVNSARACYIYYDADGRATEIEPDYCAILRTLGKPLEQTIEVH